MDLREQLADHLDHQAGTISRRQVLAAGGDDALVERMLRRREWARLHPGVYARHTGPPSWEERAWAAVLLRAPSALGGASALRAHGLRTGAAPDDAALDVVVPHRRRVDPVPGVRTTRLRDFEAVAQLHLGPPRVRLEHAVLTVAAEARNDDGAVAVLGDACQSRRTTPARLLDALASRPRLAGRRLLTEVLGDVTDGAWSALERRYVADVERPHGLPVGRRQVRARSGPAVAYRDVEYAEQRTLVELDGRLGHERAADRWADLERDAWAAADDLVTLRLGWRQVLDACRTADLVGRVLRRRGWKGAVRACSTCDRGGPPAPGAGEPPLSAA